MAKWLSDRCQLARFLHGWHQRL